MAKAHQRETEVAWAAGLIDGEGCLRVQPNGTPDLTIDMVHQETIHRIRGIFGGTVRSYKRSRRVWRWRARSCDVQKILAECQPYFITKGREAWELLHYLEAREHTLGGGKHTKNQKRAIVRIRLKLSKLKRDPRQPTTVSPAGTSLHLPVGGPAPANRPRTRKV